ncbi:MAG: hypothetical protein DRG78_11115 [Epsilonproteobacteria bacterium]|nr:MAG: hypothetical protein DRG78_11115 [Campylobacterota bacterium]
MKFGIMQSPLTNAIYVGRLNKKGNEFLEKHDMSLEAFMAVVNHIATNMEDEGNNTVNISSEKVVYSLTLTIKDKVLSDE